ncbi:MAG: hypothetical protein B6D56_06915 [Candidatus Omnitrophica bacterium 4484_70.1]|nr:MAG: hypothetical protein B6D56_06915 [Candidatus Omnitrophica bacterium 4484_70.1]
MSFNELKWVEFLKHKIKKNKNLFVGIGDDCAIFKEGKNYYLLSSDSFVENVHFQRGKISWINIGKRATARAISDIAACAGHPKFINVCLGVPSWLRKTQLRYITRGIITCAQEHKAVVVGGDTCRSPIIFVNVYVVGKTHRPILRNQAKEEDYIFITGKLGKLKFNQPFRAKVKEADYLVKRFKVNSMIDISDGLIIDLYRILVASKKGALLYKDNLPIYKSWDDIYRGEDYELIFTVDKKESKLERLFLNFYFIGKIKPQSFGYKIKVENKLQKIKVKGFLHF